MHTVSICLRNIQSLIEERIKTPLVVTGEVTNSYSNGYTSLTLIGGGEELRVYISPTVMGNVFAKIQDHQVIEVTGFVSLFRGKIQLKATDVKILGSAQTRYNTFNRTSNNIEPLPRIIANVAVISSASGAVYADLENNLRYGVTKLFNTTMQGPNVAKEISDQINNINRQGGFDCICIIRGGGSTIDFYGYNDINLAETIENSKIPILTAIGHDANKFNCDTAAVKSFSTPSILASYLNEHHERILNQPKPKINYFNILRYTHFPYKKVFGSSLTLYLISKYLFS